MTTEETRNRIENLQKRAARINVTNESKRGVETITRAIDIGMDTLDEIMADVLPSFQERSLKNLNSDLDNTEKALATLESRFGIQS